MNYDALEQKKSQLDQRRPLPKALVQNLDDWFRVELTYTSNAIEGNTLTRQETALIVEKGITVGGKSLSEHLEATNHAEALEWVRGQANRNPQSLTQKDILKIHEVVLRGIDTEHAGYYRSIPVRIAGSRVVLPNPIKVPDLMNGFDQFLKKSKNIHPVELAAEVHYQLVSIHPFVDGNGRTARLLMNIVLMMCGYPMAIIRKRDRLSYLKALERAQLGASKADFMQIIMKAVHRSLDIYLKAIEGEVEVDDDGKLLKIGELAKRSEQTTSTIRHWTKEGLLEVADITVSGYQLYSAEMLERIPQILDMKAKRLTLPEIKEKLKGLE